MKKHTNSKTFLNKQVQVKIDRPLGTKHPKYGFEYEVNYGYVPNTISPDGEELDAYVLGVNKPLMEFTGKCIAIIHRTNDNDDKLVIVPEGFEITDEEIGKRVEFQEKWFEYKIIREVKMKQKKSDKGLIVFLLGTSCTGKTTLIEEIARQDKQKPKEERVNWVVDGHDLEYYRHPNKLQISLDIVNKEDKATFDELIEFSRIHWKSKNDTKNFNEEWERKYVCMMICWGYLIVEDYKISLLEDGVDIDEFINKLSKNKASLYSKVYIEKLSCLVKKYYDIFQKKLVTQKKQTENIFARAIESSKKGEVVILDLVPFHIYTSGYNVMKEFRKYLEERDFECPTYVALVHCNMDKIVERMEARKDVTSFSYFREYGGVYSMLGENDNREVVGETKIQDIINAYKKYGRNPNRNKVVKVKDNNKVLELVRNLGIPENYKLDEVIKLGVKSCVPYDKIYQTYPNENLQEIARKINEVARMKFEVAKKEEVK